MGGRFAAVAFFAVLCCTARAVAAPASPAPEGTWYFSGADMAAPLQLTQGEVKIQGHLFCSDAVAVRPSLDFAVVDCRSPKGPVQVFWFFETAERALIWIVESGGRSPSGPLMTARRRLDSPLPEYLHGTWRVPPFSPIAQPRPADIEALEIGPGRITVTRGRGSLQTYDAIPVSAATPVVHEVFLSNTKAKETLLLLEPVPGGALLVLRELDGGRRLLQRDGAALPWFPGPTGTLAGICGLVEDASQRDACRESRGECEAVFDPKRAARCREAVTRTIAEAEVAKVRAHLGAIRAIESAYFAEHGTWVGNQPYTPVADRRGNREEVPWAAGTRFFVLGFAPDEGRVRCSYALEGTDLPAREEGFTARAQCDLDADGSLSTWTVTDKTREIEHAGDDY